MLPKTKKSDIPRPGDRSPNDPTFIVPRENVLAFLSKHTGSKGERLTENGKKLYEKKAIEAGWDDAKFCGDQCILTMNFPKRTKRKAA